MDPSTASVAQRLEQERAVQVDRQLLTLILIHQPEQDRILLGMKKRGFGQGKWNGFGGKVEPGESFEAATKRELMEEAGIECLDMVRAGILWFSLEDAEGIPYRMQVVLFRGSKILGEPTETEEMIPQWFPTSKIPFHAMWTDDSIWFPYLLSQRPFIGSFTFAPDHTTIKYSNIHTVDSLPGLDSDTSSSPKDYMTQLTQSMAKLTQHSSS
ncbi:MAG: NUDIX hydrolase domain-like protein [Piptocephalis tieghemiana]|nr:MAG: NUDIX hydrolase domain-like protein [Piptocephalis tieghemiana]